LNSNDPPPDYMKLYDNVRNQNEKLRAQVEQLTIERDQAIKDLREALFIKADAVSKQIEQASEGEARLTDQKMLTDFVINALKRKPREVIIKYKGSIILEITPK
jgi:hypothetical protein